MRRLRYLVAAGLLAAAICAVQGARGAVAAGPTDLQNDIQASQSDNPITANDVDTAAEFNVDDGAVQDVQEENGQSGDQGTAADSSAAQGNTDNGQVTGSGTATR